MTAAFSGATVSTVGTRSDGARVGGGVSHLHAPARLGRFRLLLATWLALGARRLLGPAQVTEPQPVEPEPAPVPRDIPEPPRELTAAEVEQREADREALRQRIARSQSDPLRHTALWGGR